MKHNTKIISLFFLIFCIACTNTKAQNVFNSSGPVGIGTGAPASLLHIANGDVLLQSTTTGYPVLWSKDITGSKKLRLDYNSLIVEGDNAVITAIGKSLFINTLGGGNVGVGTTNVADPNFKLLSRLEFAHEK